MTTTQDRDLERKADVAEAMVPVAVRLVAAVRDDGPDAVRGILCGIPEQRAHFEALAVVLAAMVDPDRTPLQLLGWVDAPMLPPDQRREHGSEQGYQQHYAVGDMPACAWCLVAHAGFAAGKEAARLKLAELPPESEVA